MLGVRQPLDRGDRAGRQPPRHEVHGPARTPHHLDEADDIGLTRFVVVDKPFERSSVGQHDPLDRPGGREPDRIRHRSSGLRPGCGNRHSDDDQCDSGPHRSLPAQR